MKIQDIHFLDIETVPGENPEIVDYETISLFNKKFEWEMAQDPTISAQQFYAQKAGLYAEFGKVVCVSIGKMQATKFYVKTLVNKNEKDLLTQLASMLENANFLCAHNGKDFDFPFLIRRFIIHGLPIPKVLDTIGKKPWDIPHFDTMEMWGSTQWKYRTSLELLAHLFGLPSPKRDMSGADVAKVWFDMFNVPNDQLPFEKEELAFKKIGEYCAGDIVTLANVFSKIKGLEFIKPEQIHFV